MSLPPRGAGYTGASKNPEDPVNEYKTKHATAPEFIVLLIVCWGVVLFIIAGTTLVFRALF